MRLLTSSLLALSVLVAPAFAADKPAAKAEGTFDGARATGPFLTKQELRKCMAQRDTLKAQDVELVKEQAALADQKAEINRTGDELKTRVDTIDRTKPEEVNAYNEAVVARDAQIEAYQARVNTFNTGVVDNRAAHDQFSQACGNRRYLEDDETAIRKGK